jgi:hypothetical protein
MAKYSSQTSWEQPACSPLCPSLCYPHLSTLYSIEIPYSFRLSRPHSCIYLSHSVALLCHPRGASILRRLRSPPRMSCPVLATPRPGAAGHCQAAPPSSTADWLDPTVPHSTLRRTKGKRTKNVCWKHIFQVFQMFQRYVCKYFRWMLQMKIGMLYMLQWLYTYVAKVCSRCFIRVFEWMLQICLSRCCVYFIHVSSVSEACFKCLICLLLYVASVASECFKSR